MTLPLEGVRVADFTWQLAGPIATRHLATLGADVIRIETGVRPDTMRKLGPFPPGKEGLNVSPFYNSLNYSKKSCTLNLATPQGRGLALQIVRVSDVVVENFAYGVMEKLGLGYADVRRERPDILMVSLSGMGRTGPHKAYVAYGTTLHAYSGIFHSTGYEGGPPRAISGTWSDPATGTLATFLIVAALHYRRKTGASQYFDVAMSETTWAMLPEPLLEYVVAGRVPGPAGNDDGVMAPCNTYACRGDDQWLALAVSDDAEWAGLCKVMGEPQWARDERFADQYRRWRHRDVLDRHIANWVRDKDKWELARALQAVGVAAAPCLNVDEIANDLHLREREFFVTLHHPEAGSAPTPGLPARLTDTRPIYAPAPLLGQHNEAVLGELLGIPQERLGSLQSSGVVR